jgi:hypothetical protein
LKSAKIKADQPQMEGEEEFSEQKKEVVKEDPTITPSIKAKYPKLVTA